MLTFHTAFMNETKAYIQNQSTQLHNQTAQLRNLEVQMGHMAILLTDRQLSSLRNAEVNRRREGKKHVKAITLRSGSTGTATNGDKSRD